MESNNYSIMNVISHLKHCMKSNSSKYYLVLEYKFAKPNETIEGNKKFENILKKSHQEVIVMNGNRQVKTNDYVHLKSDTSFEEYQWFQKNLKNLQNIEKIKISKLQKVDVNNEGQKITFDSQKQKWLFKLTRALFRPNYETVKDGKLFRISLTSQGKGDFEPKNKVVQVISGAMKKAISNKQAQKLQKHQDNKAFRQIPLRFKNQTTYSLSESIDIVTSRVYQVSNVELFKNILQLVDKKQNSEKQTVGKMILAELVKEVLHQKMDFKYEVELRFQPQVIHEFQDMHDQEIAEIMQKSLQIFGKLSKDPNQFSAEQVLKRLNELKQK